MKIWYDACTGKHMRYGSAIAERFRKCGHEVVLTTRKHPDTLNLAKKLGEAPIVVGKYDPASLSTRLKESAERMLKLWELVEDYRPDVAISHQSVELCRVAFGLNMPTIVTADTPHAVAVNKLTVPLANTLITSEAIPRNFYRRFGAQRIIQFKGVDEVAWIKGLKPAGDFDFERPLIIVRQMETKSAYAVGKADITMNIAQKLASLGKVVFLTRYCKSKKKGLTVVTDFVDSASLVAEADLVVSAGGTIAREAALQGVPSIVTSEFGGTYVNRYLSQKGFPLIIADSSRILTHAKKHLGRRLDVKDKIAELENPVDIIEKTVVERHYA